MPRIIATTLFFIAALAHAGMGQTPAPPSGPVTLQEAVEFATKNYPAIRASLAETAAAGSGIDLARTAYLPRAEMLLQFNHATRNNVFGLMLPNNVVPAISGPVLGETTYQSTFGSAAGVLFSWEALDFGLRGANVRIADALRSRAHAGQDVAAYEVSLATADAYLNAVASQQAVRAAQAAVERMQIFADAVAILVRNELRPGADESRARAELAQARTDLIRAEQAAQVALATLAEWMGVAGTALQVQAAPLLADPPLPLEEGGRLDVHPLARAQDAEIAVVEARRQAIEKEWRPKFEVQSALYGRGTGANVDGFFDGGAHGLAPSRGNWAIGVSLRFNVMDYKQNRLRRQIEEHREGSERARKEQVVQQLTGDVTRARIAVEAARRVAANTPIGLEAARTLEIQAQARYKASLGTVIEVADAQRLLRQAEVDDALARLGIWSAQLALAAAQGEIEAVLAAASR